MAVGMGAEVSSSIPNDNTPEVKTPKSSRPFYEKVMYLPGRKHIDLEMPIKTGVKIVPIASLKPNGSTERNQGIIKMRHPSKKSIYAHIFRSSTI